MIVCEAFRHLTKWARERAKVTSLFAKLTERYLQLQAQALDVARSSLASDLIISTAGLKVTGQALLQLRDPFGDALE